MMMRMFRNDHLGTGQKYMLRGIYLNFFGALNQRAMRKQAAILLFLLLAALPAFCSEPQSCPWLNAATAGGFLGGDATAAIKPSAKNTTDFTCTFLHHKGNVTATLRIEVDTLAEPMAEHPHDAFELKAAQCGKTASSLTVVGNEAMICEKRTKTGALAEHVVGRVRDRIFLLDISSNTPHIKEADLHDKAEQISEQVAGILF